MNNGGVRPRPLRPIGKLLAEDTRRHHRSLILQHLFAEGPASRADLARATGLTRVTVSDLVGGLIADGLLGELGAPAESKVGKPPTLVGLLADAAHIVALDLSPDDRMTGAVVDLFGQVKARAEVPREGACGEAAVAPRRRPGASGCAAATDRPVLGVGVGTPGVVDGARRGPRRAQPALGRGRPDRHPPPPARRAGLRRQRRQHGRPRRVHLRRDHGGGPDAGADRHRRRRRPRRRRRARRRGTPGPRARSATSSSTRTGARCACGKTGCLETIAGRAAACGAATAPLASAGTVLGEVLAPVVAALNLHEVVLAGPPDLLDGELREALDATIRERVMADLVGRPGRAPVAARRRRGAARRRGAGALRRARVS